MTAPAPTFDIEHLTLGEIAQLEDLAGMSLSEFSDDSAPKAKFLTALAYLAKRRTDTTYTFSQAEAMTLADLHMVLGDAAPGEAAGA